MTESAAPDERWSRIAGSTQTLVRSQLEIARILRSVATKGAPLMAYFPDTDHLFMSSLRRVDPDGGFLIVDYASDKIANGLVLMASNVRFGCQDGGAGIEFIGARPAQTTVDEVPAIRFDFPDMLTMQQRRGHRRISALPGVPLRCIADTRGPIPFEAEVIDISVGGFGAMIYDEAIRLDVGTVLHGCKIIHPAGSIVDLDIEIRYSVVTALADGSPARRSGCRFIGASAQMEELMRVFVLDLEKRGS